MAGLFCNAEKQSQAQYQLNVGGGGTNLTLCLYKNNVTPTVTDVLGTYTEATFTGYASVTLLGGTWAVGSGPVIATYATQTFTSTANQTLQQIYGYYLKRGANLVFAERFTDGPYSIVNNGDSISVNLSLTYKNTGE